VEVLESRLLSDFCTAKVYEADQIKNRTNKFIVKTLEIILFGEFGKFKSFFESLQ
jgi:hypothetical protein